MSADQEGRRGRRDERFEVGPVDEVLGHVLDGILEIERVAVAVRREGVTVLELDRVNVVAERELVRVLRDVLQLCPARSSRIPLRQVSAHAHT